MNPIAWRRFLRARVKVWKGRTEARPSGATRLEYDQLVAENVPAAVQGASGRLRAEDVGDVRADQSNVYFGHEMIPVLVSQEPGRFLVEDQATGEKHLIVHVHNVENHHLECLATRWVPGMAEV